MTSVDAPSIELERTVATKEDYAQALVKLTDAFLLWHGCFPGDRTTKREIAMNDAMTEAYRLIGQPGTTERIEKLNATY